MAPVVRIEPNGSQTLLLFDNPREDLENSGWLVFIQIFEGFNLLVSQQFALTFDDYRAKVRDIQLELNEEFLSSATGLPATGERWFKNSKVDEVSWLLLFTSRKIVRAMPVNTLKPKWHNLLAIVKQFVTCECRYGLVFLYHLQLLMNFIDYPLNMPHYLLRSLYKMSKRFKCEKDDSSLFHHCLIKVLIVHRLSLSGDSCKPSCQGMALPLPSLSKWTRLWFGPSMPLHILLPPVKPSNCPDLDLPDTMAEPFSKDKIKTAKKPVRKKGKGDIGVNSKGKKNASWISGCVRIKPNQNVDQKPIVLSEDSDYEIECFLTKEYPYSHGLCSIEPYDYVSNLPPCLKNDPKFPGIKIHNQTPGNLKEPSPVMPNQPPCSQCNAWLERYYTNIPLLQSKIKSLEEQVTVLSKKNDKLHANEKKQKTTGSIVFKNVEAATAFVNSKLS